MTPGERDLWRAVYAASWHQSTGAPMGAVTEGDRGRWCARQATQAVDAIRTVVRETTLRTRSLEEASEVLE